MKHFVSPHNSSKTGSMKNNAINAKTANINSHANTPRILANWMPKIQSDFGFLNLLYTQRNTQVDQQSSQVPFFYHVC